jgi:hypothetical protein
MNYETVERSSVPFLYFFKAGFLFHPQFYTVKEALLPGVICKVQLYVHS